MKMLEGAVHYKQNKAYLKIEFLLTMIQSYLSR